ncbi:MAG: hypothetical protein NVSMB17_02220 [Candidatus Dormibacteria bacterium]
MSPVGLALVPVLAVTGLAMAGVLRAGTAEGGINLQVGPEGRRRHLRLESREGILADIALLLLVLTTSALVSGSRWVPGTEVLTPMLATGAIFFLLLAKVVPRGTTYWLAVEASAVGALFVSTAAHPGGPVQDFPAWVQSIRGSAALAALVTMAGAGWMVVAWSAFWVARKRNALLALSPLAVVLAVEILNDPGQHASGALMVTWILLAGVLLLRLNTARIRERWSDMADGEVWTYIASRGAVAVIALLVVAVLLPPLSTVDLSVSLFRGRSASGGGGSVADPNAPAPDSEAVGNLTQTGYSEKVAPGGTLTRSSRPVLRVSSDFGRPVYWRGINLYTIVGAAWLPGPARAVTADVGPSTPLDDGAAAARQHVHATVEVLDVAQQTLFWPGDPYQVDQPTVVRGARPSSVSGVATVEAAYSHAPVPVGTTYAVDALQSVATEDQLRSAGGVYPAAVMQLAGGPSGIGADVRDLARRVAGAAINPYDQAKNIETYLRIQEKYQLAVTAPPPGADPVSYFLFKSHVGYCEYFASSMGEMVRALGIPTRLVSGYGPGQTTPAQDIDRNFRRDTALGSAVSTIRASDAHTWVEVYFPGYGWVPFEPTPDPNYPALSHGEAAGGAKAPVPAAVPSPQVIRPPVARAPRPGPSRAPVALGLAMVAALALGLLSWGAGKALLGPSAVIDLVLPWSRLGLLGRRLGVRHRGSDTPLEFARRLAGRVPGLEQEIMLLGGAYSRERYGAVGRPGGDRLREAVAWAAVRSHLLALLALGGRAKAVSRGAATPQS